MSPSLLYSKILHRICTRNLCFKPMPSYATTKLSILFRSAAKSGSRPISAAGAADLASSIKNFLPSHPSPPSPIPSTLMDTISGFAEKPVKSHSRSSRRSSPKPVRCSSLSGSTSSEAESHGEIPFEVLHSVLSVAGSLSADSLDLREATTVVSFSQREVSRERKQRQVFCNNEVNKIDELCKTYVEKMGMEATLEVFGKLGREIGLGQYNTLIGICLERAREIDDGEVVLDEIHIAFGLFESMKEQGFKIGEYTYAPLLLYLIDKGMVKEFHSFSRLIRDDNAGSFSRLGYYEMLLYVKTSQEEMIQGLCNSVLCYNGEDKFDLIGNYIIALCEGDREELLQLLPVMDIQEISSSDSLTRIFTALGKSKLDSFVEKFLLALKNLGDVSNFILNYAAYSPNLVVDDVIFKCKSLHDKLEVKHSSTSYESIIKYCCALRQVHAAFDMAKEMCDTGLTLSMDVVYSILRASEENCDFNLVHHIYSLISCHNLKPNEETFTYMIHLAVRTKDFEAAYSMLADWEKMNLKATSRMYNAIMRGYFREKNLKGALMVLKQMEEAAINPDSETFACLISNCDSEEEINKSYEEFKRNNFPVTKHIYTALIKAYAACGQFEKAKQVIKDKDIPGKSLNEIKSVLVSVLSSNGQESDALELYEEIKHDGCNVEPIAVLSLIKHLQSDGELGRLLQLLQELTDPIYWLNGCYGVVLYCLQFKRLSVAVDLLKQLKDHFSNDEVAMEVIFDEVFSLIAEGDTTLLQMGVDLLDVIKNEMGLTPSRKVLDFLLGACINAKDLDKSLFIWKEYQAAGLPYNIMSLLRMYQALLASGDHKSAVIIQRKMPTDDADVCCIIQKCRATYAPKMSGRKPTR